VFAVGVPADDVVAAVGEAIAEAGQPPERTLVVTDALGQLGALRALGTGVEHVPAAGSRQAELAGGSYDEFVRRRLELIRAERPRARVAVAARGGMPLPSVP
jgi:hypothetical protein